MGLAHGTFLPTPAYGSVRQFCIERRDQRASIAGLVVETPEGAATTRLSVINRDLRPTAMFMGHGPKQYPLRRRWLRAGLRDSGNARRHPDWHSRSQHLPQIAQRRTRTKYRVPHQPHKERIGLAPTVAVNSATMDRAHRLADPIRC